MLPLIFSCPQTTYRIGNRVYYRVWLRPDRFKWRNIHTHTLVTGEKTPASTLYPAQRRDGALSPTTGCSTRHWLDPFRESKVQFVVEDTWPFRERASGQNGRLNPLRMDMTTEAGGFNDWGGRGYDDFTPGEVTKKDPSGDRTT